MERRACAGEIAPIDHSETQLFTRDGGAMKWTAL